MSIVRSFNFYVFLFSVLTSLALNRLSPSLLVAICYCHMRFTTIIGFEVLFQIIRYLCLWARSRSIIDSISRAYRVVRYWKIELSSSTLTSIFVMHREYTMSRTWNKMVIQFTHSDSNILCCCCCCHTNRGQHRTNSSNIWTEHWTHVKFIWRHFSRTQIGTCLLSIALYFMTYFDLFEWQFWCFFFCLGLLLFLHTHFCLL